MNTLSRLIHMPLEQERERYTSERESHYNRSGFRQETLSRKESWSIERLVVWDEVCS